MNTKGLTNMYDRLSTWERIPLLIAAYARADDRETQRLRHAAPMRTWMVAEHVPAEHTLHVLALIYAAEQLDAAASYFFALMLQAETSDKSHEDWLLSAQASAYFFVANADAWRRFCAELSISAESLTEANHPGRFLRFCEANMPSPTADNLRSLYLRCGRDPPELSTSDQLLARWRTALRAMAHTSPRRRTGMDP